jgi:predicted protein tyrosine phosphatase
MITRSGVDISDRIFEGSSVAFAVLSRAEIENARIDRPHVVISIADPESSPVRIPESDHRLGALNLAFHDVSPSVIAIVDEMAEGEPARHFELNDAQAIWEFVAEHRGQLQLIVCQCEEGISRSAAVAAALSNVLNGDDSFFFAKYAPNQSVYSALLSSRPA